MLIINLRKLKMIIHYSKHLIKLPISLRCVYIQNQSTYFFSTIANKIGYFYFAIVILFVFKSKYNGTNYFFF